MVLHQVIQVVPYFWEKLWLASSYLYTEVHHFYHLFHFSVFSMLQGTCFLPGMKNLGHYKQEIMIWDCRWQDERKCIFAPTWIHHGNTHIHTPSLMKNQVLIKSADSTQVLFRQNDYIIESLIRFQQRSLKGEQVLTIYFE